MSLTKLEENLNIIENLPDSPNLEPSELKRKFDQGPGIIKKYINETLTKEVDTLVTQINKDNNALATKIDTFEKQVNKNLEDKLNIKDIDNYFLDNLEFSFFGFLSTISGTENSIKVNKIEKSCNFSFAVNFDSAQDGNFVLASVDKEYAPKETFFSTCIIVSNNVTTACQLSILNDGCICVNNYGQPSSTFRGQIKWYY